MKHGNNPYKLNGKFQTKNCNNNNNEEEQNSHTALDSVAGW